MAAKKKEEVQEVKDADSLSLSKLLIKEFNKGDSKAAWSLTYDDDDPTTVREFISTGSTLLDYIASNRRDGGVPVGKLTEINGEEGSGKSLVCAHIAANCQKKGGIVVYIDTENAANPEFLARLGVNLKELVYLQPETIEDVGEAIEKAITMARTKAPNKLVLIMWDGIAGTPSKAELEGGFDISMNVALERARLLALQVRKMTKLIGRQRICLVYTNQLKFRPGCVGPSTTIQVRDRQD